MENTSYLIQSTSITIVSATFILVISQILNNFVFAALKEFQIIKGKISYNLVYTSNLYGLVDGNSKKKDLIKTVNDGAIELRKIACQLIEIHQTIPFKNIFIFLNIIPSAQIVKTASGNLIGLSILLFDADPWESKNEKYIEIKNLLNIL